MKGIATLIFCLIWNLALLYFAMEMITQHDWSEWTLLAVACMASSPIRVKSEDKDE